MPEFALWKADYDLEPWGEIREDRRAAATIQATLLTGDRDLSMPDAIKYVNPFKKDADAPKPRGNVKQKIRLFNAALSGRVPKAGT